jgi:hypothetical protein
MNDESEKFRNEAALKIFESDIRSQLQEPLDVAEVYSASPMLVTPYRASDKDRSFWRIPVVSRKYSRVIGFFDVRSLDEQSSAIRVSRLPRRAISEEDEISNLPIDVLELTRSDIYDQAKKTFGNNIRLVGDPELVFDRAETRVAWKVDIEKEGEVFQAMATPGYIYTP